MIRYMNIASEVIHIGQPAEPTVYTPDIFKTVKQEPVKTPEPVQPVPVATDTK